jgi:hypothetical protein
MSKRVSLRYLVVSSGLQSERKFESSTPFAEQILADLIRQGYSGEELLEKFKQTQRKIRPAVEAMLAEADRVAESKSGGYSLEDVFGTEDEK